VLQGQTLVEQSESSSSDKTTKTSKGDTSNDGIERNRALASLGKEYSLLLNSYTASGRCRNCRGSAKLISNDAAKRRRYLADGGDDGDDLIGGMDDPV
jgi:hypothetical protein